MNPYLIALCVLAAFLFAGCVGARHLKRGFENTPRPYIVAFEKTGTKVWGLTANNNEQIHLSDFAYATVADAVSHYARTRAVMQVRNTPNNIVRYPEDHGKFRWILNDANGSLLERSEQAFASANAARNNYDDVRVSVLNFQPYELKLAKFTL